MSGTMFASGMLTRTSGASRMMMQPWMSESVVPASPLPMTIEVRGTGATSISLRNPNSRSQMMLMADWIEVKMAVTGSGSADKAQVREALIRFHGLADVPTQPDAADAVAIALCHLTQSRVRRAARAVALR